MIVEICKLSNEALSEKLTATVREERRLTVEILHLLREVERRELFAVLGFSSLFTYCVQYLKYSESAAQRRIVAMRALKDVPELSEKIETGKLSLSVLALAESTLRQNAKRENRLVGANERRDVLREVEGLSRRQAEATLVQKFDLAPLKFESIERPMNNGGVRIVLELTEEEMIAIEELRRLSSVPRTAKEMIMTLVKAETGRRKRAIGETPLLKKSSSAGGGIKVSIAPLAQYETHPTPLRAELKREAWMRSQGRCEHRNAFGERCNQRHALEFDHVKPRAMGGLDEIENIRLLCRSHHRLVTTQAIGRKKMMKFRPTLRLQTFPPAAMPEQTE